MTTASRTHTITLLLVATVLANSSSAEHTSGLSCSCDGAIAATVAAAAAAAVMIHATHHCQQQQLYVSLLKLQTMSFMRAVSEFC
jgi:hypothetical protein